MPDPGFAPLNPQANSRQLKVHAWPMVWTLQSPHLPLDPWFELFHPPTSPSQTNSRQPTDIWRTNLPDQGFEPINPPPPPPPIKQQAANTFGEQISLTKDLNPSTPPPPPQPPPPPPDKQQAANIWRTNLPDQGSEPLNPPLPVRLTAGSRQTHTSHTAQDLTARLTVHKRWKDWPFGRGWRCCWPVQRPGSHRNGAGDSTTHVAPVDQAP